MNIPLTNEGTLAFDSCPPAGSLNLLQAPPGGCIAHSIFPDDFILRGDLHARFEPARTDCRDYLLAYLIILWDIRSV